MSFLNSVLSSIGGSPSESTGRNPPPSSNPAIVQKPHPPTTNSPLSLGRPKPFAQNEISEKRKAEAQLPRLQDKSSKLNATSIASPAANRLERAERSGKPQISTSKMSRLGAPKQNSSQISRPATPTSTSKAPPKKGSFAEIMARAESARQAAAAAPLGVIKHKPKEKIGAKKEILMRKKGIPIRGKEEETLKMSDRITGNPGAPSGVDRADGKSKPKPAPTTGYTGTAKPKPQSSYKGTMKPDLQSKASHRKDKFVVSDGSDDGLSRPKKMLPPRRRDLDSEDEEAYGLDDEEDFDSGAESSDMEAGFSDVEEENERAARLARKEDEKELKLLDEKKREKEDRRRRMEALAAKNRRK